MRVLPILAVLLLSAAPPCAGAQRAPQSSRAGRLPRLVPAPPAPAPHPPGRPRPHASRGRPLGPILPFGLWPYWTWSVPDDEAPAASPPPLPAGVPPTRVPPTRVIDVVAEARATAERARSAYAGVVIVGPPAAASPP